MPRSRAIALRCRDPAPWLPRLVLLAALIAGMVAAQAQGQGPATAPLLPPGAGGSQRAAPLQPPRTEHPDTPANAGLGGNGVSRANPDPGIIAPPPGIGSTVPVAPPASVPHSDGQVVPK